MGIIKNIAKKAIAAAAIYATKRIANKVVGKVKTAVARKTTGS
jgi:hypothetical protein